MRPVMILSAALLGLALPASELAAGTRPHRSKGYVHHRPSHVTPAQRYETEGWYEHIADHLPIGSRIWWDQMHRERRLGGGGP